MYLNSQDEVNYFKNSPCRFNKNSLAVSCESEYFKILFISMYFNRLDPFMKIITKINKLLFKGQDWVNIYSVENILNTRFDFTNKN
jgi:hypothetical protein